ncbi:hypothetical protein DCMF_08155 [Candidatus Formimonas warabiya]|uniref:Uroporphyrinogen decarboxylase (URO-D) domain-containing protein n=2 Tax=Formimonas warabiya TaxID=1761012 RepID=A0A3G1L1F9_FORW1|nr:hypothetical protein DCMF_08155 [Candidatus Formimonas warabiya]
MNSRDRFLAALNRQEVDRPCVGNPTSVATVESMESTGAFFPWVHQDADKMAALAAAGHELLEFDTVSPYFSVQQETAALGGTMNWGTETSMPDNYGPIWRQPEEVRVPPDFLDRLPIKTVLKAVKLLKKRYKNEVAIIGKTMGPWTLAYHTYGTQNFLMDTILEPEKVRDFLRELQKITVLFANAQFEEGADAVTIADHATGDLVGPATYKEFLFPVHQEINRKINGPTILHICGNTLDRMPYIAQAGFKCFHFDSKVNAGAAMEAVHGQISLAGNLNNVELLMKGTPERVKDQVKKLVITRIQIIGPECAVPLTVRNANLQAIVQVVKEMSGCPIDMEDEVKK